LFPESQTQDNTGENIIGLQKQEILKVWL
jgi:hypothetical protein